MPCEITLVMGMREMTMYELYHHGILGQRWGVRRFQNKDGSLTSAGKSRAKKHSPNFQRSMHFQRFMQEFMQEQMDRQMNDVIRDQQIMNLGQQTLDNLIMNQSINEMILNQQINDALINQTHMGMM